MRTFLIIKPEAVNGGLTDAIRQEVERSGFRVVDEVERTLSPEDVASLYESHRDRPFYGKLIEQLSSGPSVGMMLEGPDAVTALRKLVGATDPAEAAPGTLRARFGVNLQLNAVHASDSDERVVLESAVYFGRASDVEAGGD